MLPRGLKMARKPDWKALSKLFAQPASNTPPEASCASGSDRVTYLGESIPKWLARDLTQERAAIREFEGGETREVAEVETLKRLKS